jgi:hypothetical protein
MQVLKRLSRENPSRQIGDGARLSAKADLNLRTSG